MRADRRRKRSAGLWRGRFRNENQAALPTADTDAAPEEAQVFDEKEKLADTIAEPAKEAHARAFPQLLPKEEARIRKRESDAEPHARRVGVADAAIEKEKFSLAIAETEAQVLAHSRTERDANAVAISKPDAGRVAQPRGKPEPVAQEIAAAGRDRFA